MTSAELEQVVLDSPRFAAEFRELTRQAILSELPTVSPARDPREIDWNVALFGASALTDSQSRSAQDSVLRIAQYCLRQSESVERRTAAAVLLERLGNRPAIDLAVRRQLITPDSWTNIPAPLQLDVIHRRLELTIPAGGPGPIHANQFQRRFWTAASAAQWLSVSAPTSAGKSYIVRRWLEARASDGVFQGAYVVPTRALIEEVSQTLREEFVDTVAVHTLPWDAMVGTADRELFVLTQERLHLLQQRIPDFAPNVLFIDEAQKFGDGTRGVLLQQVLDESVTRRPDTQVIFASPHATNPELLLDGAPEGQSATAFVSDLVTVNQNLLWADQIRGRPMDWELKVVDEDEMTLLGTFSLPARPSPTSKRLPLVAVAIAGANTGNVVYVNGAGAAEVAARQIYEALGEAADISSNPEIAALQELAATSVHPRYALHSVLGRGVAFHYGNMPQLLRAEIERLFRQGVLRYLICTSTLLEGVNLPCRNLFARGPKKGNGRPMTLPDFWNLAGRAGRWGMEFQGNIICVDARDAGVWPSPPQVRVGEPIRRTADEVLSRVDDLIAYADVTGPVDRVRFGFDLEAVFSMLAARVSQGRTIRSIKGLALSERDASRLQDAIANSLGRITIPATLISRHAGISPVAMQRLLDSFDNESDVAGLTLAPPESRDAATGYAHAMALCDTYLGSAFGANEGRRLQLAILIVEWMRGRPLARLVEDRWSFMRSRGRELSPVIRGVLVDVEQYARFQAPRYLACYSDVLLLHIERAGLRLEEEPLDISMMLELGVSRQTDVSLMALGLSRTSSIALSEYIIEDDLSPDDVRTWIRRRDLDELPLPALVRREIASKVE